MKRSTPQDAIARCRGSTEEMAANSARLGQAEASPKRGGGRDALDSKCSPNREELSADRSGWGERSLLAAICPGRLSMGSKQVRLTKAEDAVRVRLGNQKGSPKG